MSVSAFGNVLLGGIFHAAVLFLVAAGLLLAFAMVLMFQDVFRFIWGANPQSLDNVQLVYGKIAAGDFIVPVYNLLVIAAAVGAASLIGLFLQRTNYGRLLRATAENRTM